MLSKTRITVLALTGAIAMTGTAEAASTPKLTIQGPNGDFQGTIKAKKRRCMNNRTVHVYMVTDQGPQEIGSDTSELNSQKTRGRWSIGNSGYKNGRFFAKADAKGSCKPLTSKTITVVTPDAADPSTPTTIAAAATDAGSAGIPGYDDATCQGLLKDVQMSGEIEAQEIEDGTPDSSRAKQASEIGNHAYAQLEDNCLVVYE
ncbi:MAG TPA: hypothetical protein VJU80_06910 [Solirubrobacteraceae bacterium]|nr:hypothetical protein [Solirubrobacteraceae bacterium]